MEQKEKTTTNCPNCGAPLSPNGYCEYCGTTVHDDQHPKGKIEITAGSIVIGYY